MPGICHPKLRFEFVRFRIIFSLWRVKCFQKGSQGALRVRVRGTRDSMAERQSQFDRDIPKSPGNGGCVKWRRCLKIATAD